jgi:cytochrome c553
MHSPRHMTKLWAATRFFLIGTAVLCNASLAGEVNLQWKIQMQSLAQVLSELLPALVARKENMETIKKNAKTLMEISSSLPEGLHSGKMSPADDIDPSLKIIAQEFSKETKQAYASIESGHVAYGKNRLRTISSYCISCHTRNDNGPNFPMLTLSPKLEGLPKEDRANFYVATRQFDLGLQALKELIAGDDLIKSDPFAWETALKTAVAILIKVKQDPLAAENLVGVALQSEDLPEYLRTYLVKWKTSLREWQKEAKQKPIGDKALVIELRRLNKLAKAGQLYPADKSSEIIYLRAEAVASELLRRTQNPEIRAEALLTVGSATELLNNFALWPMQEHYYRACVEQKPHSKIAMRCYERFEESVYAGYSGSGGMFLPEEVRKSLSKLRKLAIKENP